MKRFNLMQRIVRHFAGCCGLMVVRRPTVQEWIDISKLHTHLAQKADNANSERLCGQLDGQANALLFCALIVMQESIPGSVPDLRTPDSAIRNPHSAFPGGAK